MPLDIILGGIDFQQPAKQQEFKRFQLCTMPTQVEAFMESD